jgi:hypothetical protein
MLNFAQQMDYKGFHPWLPHQITGRAHQILGRLHQIYRCSGLARAERSPMNFSSSTSGILCLLDWIIASSPSSSNNRINDEVADVSALELFGIS